MPNYIVHHNGAYNFYTTIADGACYESALTIEQVTEIVQREAGEEGLRQLPYRLQRAQQHGCSSGESLADTLVCNRAGENESELTEQEFIDRFLTLAGSATKPLPEQSK